MAKPNWLLLPRAEVHQVAAGVTAGLMMLLIGFAVIQAAELRRITRERDRANGITEFMTNMFKVTNPSEARGKTVTAREILDKASQDIDAGLTRDPDLQSGMMDVIYITGTARGVPPGRESWRSGDEGITPMRHRWRQGITLFSVRIEFSRSTGLMHGCEKV